MGVYGKGEDCKFLDQTTISGTDPIVSHPLNAMQDYDIVGVQLVVDPLLATIDVEDTDTVDASSTLWSLANFDFTGLEDGVLHVSGAAEAGNNGDWIVTTGGNGTAVTAAAVGLVDETFDPDTVVITFTYPTTAEGDWTIEISNDTTPASMAGSYDQDADVEGHWTDITDSFTPSIATVDTADAASYSQYVQATICVRSMRFTFTPTTGDGYALVLGQARSYS